MCGRAVEISDIQAIAAEFGVHNPSLTIAPNYNVAPSQNVITVIKQGTRQLVGCRWGFIPSWAKDPAIGDTMINARAETIATKPAYRSAYRKQRCLIIADGFYEWQKSGKRKTPYFIRMKSGRPFGMAGIYSQWISAKGETVLSCSIITTGANELLAAVHDRMPVIIPKEKIDAWLDANTTDDVLLSSMLKPYASEEMEMYEISTRVNDPRHNAADLLEPVVHRSIEMDGLTRIG